MDNKHHFSPTNFALKNKISFFIIALMIVLYGLVSYNQIPKEDFPEIKIPFVFVSTLYPGVSPKDMETLVTKEIEKQLKSLSDVKHVTSYSSDSFSSITIEFEVNVDVDDALQKVRDKVNLAKPDLPEDAEDPVVQELNFDRVPVMILSFSGPYNLLRLKQIAEKVQDQVDTISGVLDTQVVGGLEREINVLVDAKKLAHYNLSFDKISQSIAQENVTIPGGKIELGNVSYTLRVPGEFSSPDDISGVVVKSEKGHPIFVRDVAEVDNGFKDQSSFSRYQEKNSVSIVVTKRTGVNLIELSEEIHHVLEDSAIHFPKYLNVAVVGDRSEHIKDMVNELINSIITGVLLVFIVLLFFLGKRNALFVGIAIPLSMLMSFIVLRLMGITMNMVVLFSLILALGMLVDNGIVIVENIFRHRHKGKSMLEASQLGTGEVAHPVISSTLTTLAAFSPLLFWPGMMGKFMYYLPLTLVIALTSSLFVALFITPVFCANFMSAKKEDSLSGADFTKTKSVTMYKKVLQKLVARESNRPPILNRLATNVGVMGSVIVSMMMVKRFSPDIDYALHLKMWENMVRILDRFGVSLALLFITVALLGYVWVSISPTASIQKYKKWFIILFVGVIGLISAPFFDTISGPARFLAGLIPLFPLLFLFNWHNRYDHSYVRRTALVHAFMVLFLASIMSLSGLNTVFFPHVTPERVFVKLEMAEGTTIDKTNEVISRVEAVISNIMATGKHAIRHYVTNVGSGNSDPFSVGADTPHTAEISLQFYKSEKFRKIAKKLGVKAEDISPFVTMAQIREGISSIPGGTISVVEEEGGPPTGLPISLEITGDSFDVLEQIAEDVKAITAKSEGVINLTDTQKLGSPEIQVIVDREKAAILGLNIYKIASTLRSAVNGVESTTYREGDDDIDINVKLKADQRYDLDILKYLTIEGRNDAQIILSQVSDIHTTSGSGTISRVDHKRVITVQGDVSKESDRTPADVLKEIEQNLAPYKAALPDGYTIEFKGEQEEQQAAMAFLTEAFMIALLLIALILISQFNSVVLPFIILFSVVLSMIGVIMGLFLAPLLFTLKFETQPFVVIMTGVGVVSLAGVVVNNAIVLLDYIRQLRDDGMEKIEA
ncbi:MAG: efflux RND transporter permease subunit, partial [Candidatus Margulisbacteria bacterium]|nr:efflux RND transporter permease subunit [Candidatus Margulisiibacteriota bacterium]